MFKELSASVITMGLLYLISFAVYADEQNKEVIGQVIFYDIPTMIGERESITIDLKQDNDVYLWKMNKSLDETSLNDINLRLDATHLLDYIEPVTYDQTSKDLNIASSISTFTVNTKIPDWNALVVKPKKNDNPGYIYYYSNGYLYGVDIFFEGDPTYLKDTVTESLLNTGYSKSISDNILFNDTYSKGSSVIHYNNNVDEFTSIDGDSHYTNYSYIRFRNKDIVNKDAQKKSVDFKAAVYQIEIKNKLGI